MKNDLGGTVKKRFEDKYIPMTECGCWIWAASVNRQGYGQMSSTVPNKPFAAHRLAYMLYNGEIPEGMHILHKCDTPACVNPSHLFLGTNADNIKDMHNKNRAKFDHLPHPLGADHRGTRLTNSAVLKIRKDSRPHKEIAADYGIKRVTVCAIKKRRNWGWLEDVA